MVYVVYYKYNLGWKTHRPDILEELNKEPILGLYSNYNQALKKAIEYNIKYYYDSDEELLELNKLNISIDNINTYTLYELEIIYNKLNKVFHSKTDK